MTSEKHEVPEVSSVAEEVAQNAVNETGTWPELVLNDRLMNIRVGLSGRQLHSSSLNLTLRLHRRRNNIVARRLWQVQP